MNLTSDISAIFWNFPTIYNIISFLVISILNLFQFFNPVKIFRQNYFPVNQISRNLIYTLDKKV